LNAEELATLKQVRAFADTKVAPVVNKYWVEDAFPLELLPAFKELNIFGVGLQGYECRGGSAMLAGFIGGLGNFPDGSVRSAVSAEYIA
jgi:glutaryl-CoA dehydrogenase